MIIINFKNYKVGKKVVKLAKVIETYLPKAIVAVPVTEIEAVRKATKLTVYAQHVDSSSKRGTGSITIEAVKAAGAQGTLLNHSEHPLHFKELRDTIRECRKAGLAVIVCAKNLADVEQMLAFKPYAIALEDPHLIASGKPITAAHPVMLLKFVKLLKLYKIPALCGAGIQSAQDMRAALELGCQGVLIASAIANSFFPKKLLKRLAEVECA